jgi:clan AA aspartic protease (TIGR02281 family)
VPEVNRQRLNPDDKTTRIRVSRAGTSMMVQVRLNNSVTAPFLIDTGASDVLVPQAVADQLGIQVGPNTRTKRYSTANGVITTPVVMLRSVALGDAVVENVPASISPSMKVGLLGLSFFNHFTYNIDAARGIVSLRPNNLAENGSIRGGRSQAQWTAEYANLRRRIERLDAEKKRTPSSHGREHRRLAKVRDQLDREQRLLDGEADQARVPMVWR